MCNNPCQICGDNEECSFYTPDCPFEPPMSYAEANFILNHHLIKRDDKSFIDYIKEHFDELNNKKTD